MRFGISTHLYHDQRLQREHLAQIASYGFEAVELFATRNHFDYHDDAAMRDVARWLADTGLTLASVHAPIAERYAGGQWSGPLSTAAADNGRRQAAVREIQHAMTIASHIPVQTIVVHLGTPRTWPGADDNSRSAARRSAEEICRLAEPLGVRVAFEVIPNDLSDAATLAALIERDLEAPHAGICLDLGHAHLMEENVADAIEIAAEHVIAAHVHDNHGRQDDHLAPYLGSIDWDLALVAMQKIGYDGTYLMELAGTRPAADVLEDARRARQRFERTLTYA